MIDADFRHAGTGPVSVRMGKTSRLCGLPLLTESVLPLVSHVAYVGKLSTALINQSSGVLSKTALPCGREKAAWLAVLVAAAWPDTQWYYSNLAVPTLKGAPIATALMVFNIRGTTVASAIVIAWQARLFSLERLRAAWDPTGLKRP